MESLTIEPSAPVTMYMHDNAIYYTREDEIGHNEVFLANAKLDYINEMWSILIEASNQSRVEYLCPGGQVPVCQIFHDLATRFELQLDDFCPRDIVAHDTYPYIYVHLVSGKFYFEGHGLARVFYGPYENATKANMARVNAMFPKRPDPYSKL